jgi:threonine/homoserine/homoserine lactone efflux protein
MLTYMILGATYGFAAGMQPGPLQAFLISRTMTNGWRRTVPASLAPLLSDAPIIALVLLVLAQVPHLFLSALQIAGGAFLLYLARNAFLAARNYQQAIATPSSVHETFLKAVVVNFLNPNPYLGWTLILGPLLLQAWHQAPISGVGFVAAFYVTLVTATAAIVMLLALARSLGPRVARVLVGISAVALAGFGMYQLWAGSTALLRATTDRTAPSAMAVAPPWVTGMAPTMETARAWHLGVKTQGGGAFRHPGRGRTTLMGTTQQH